MNFQKQEKIEQIPFVINTIIAILLVNAMLTFLQRQQGDFIHWVIIGLDVIFAACLFLEMPGACKGLINIAIAVIIFSIIFVLTKNITPLDGTLDIILSFCLIGLLNGPGSRRKAIVLGIIPLVFISVTSIFLPMIVHGFLEKELKEMPAPIDVHELYTRNGLDSFSSPRFHYSLDATSGWKIIKKEDMPDNVIADPHNLQEIILIKDFADLSTFCVVLATLVMDLELEKKDIENHYWELVVRPGEDVLQRDYVTVGAYNTYQVIFRLDDEVQIYVHVLTPRMVVLFSTMGTAEQFEQIMDDLKKMITSLDLENPQ